VKRIYLTFIALFVVVISYAQIDDNFNVLLAQPCPYDPSVTVNLVEGWDIFQAIDGSEYSDIDSTICINVDAAVSLVDIDERRPLFLDKELTLNQLPN
jgi:hypothetical protein